MNQVGELVNFDRAHAASSVREQALLIDCAGERLVAIAHLPAEASSTGVVVIVGGPQYRAGSHRQFVLLARAVAAAGYAVLRFDVRGMGDSGGDVRSFEDLDADVGAAIDQLQRSAPSVRQVVLWGLCDGASAALLYCDRTGDPRVAGVCALNPWVRSEASLAKTHLKHYYRQRLLQREFWAKLLRFKVGPNAIADLLRKTAAAAAGDRPDQDDAVSYQQRMARGCARLKGRLLLVLSENDLTAREFADHVAGEAAWQRELALPRVERRTLEGADHTFSSLAAAAAVERITIDWLARA
ncbi:hydrolase 1, exosortase A system-associated [Piscinibacter koreensis]|uniref:Hydrolase 1, exosortase A system-associated n=1 Tax=Piscinibacter koreensis TaxID=2742824 RepID=A0A7Y6NLA5_9BURK|nr:hydrolase 1, exosortase A system-associated [Schlegelella koreensis]NUZ05182.1 hydrolase 1, exosortase A system-associated [Schlegelella koreensis]